MKDYVPGIPTQVILREEIEVSEEILLRLIPIFKSMNFTMK